MSIPFSCTSCGRGLRANPELAGKRTKCPGCGTVLTIPAANGGAAKPAAAPAPAADAAGAIVACACGAKIRTKPEWAGKTIKCPKCESRLKVPGGAPAPVAAKPAPRPAPPPADDPFDGGFGGPADDPFAGGESESFSAEPFGGGQSDDEPMAAPARRGGKTAAPAAKKKGGGRVVLYSILLLLVLGVGGFSAWAFLLNNQSPVIPGKPIAQIKDDGKDDDDDDKTPKTDGKVVPKDKTPVVDPAPDPKVPDETPKIDVPEKKPVDPPAAVAELPVEFVPPDASGFISIKPQSAFKVGLVQKALADFEGSPGGKNMKAVFEGFGINATDIEEVVIAATEPPLPPADPTQHLLIIVASKKPLDFGGFNTAVDGVKPMKKDVGGIPYYVVDEGGKTTAMTAAGPKTIIGGAEETVVKFLTTKAPKDGQLAPMIKAAAGDHVLFAGFIVPKELPEILQKGAPGPVKEMAAPFVEIRTVQLVVTAGDAIKAQARLRFDDAEKANKARDGIGGLVLLGGAALPELKKSVPPPVFALLEGALKSVAPTVTDNVVVVPLQIDATLDQLGEIFAMFAGGPPQKKLEAPE